MAKKILVAVDDSENAGRAVNFLADNFVRDLQITLFSVCPDTATLCEMDSPALIPYFKSRQSDFCVLEDEKKKLVREALEGAREKLMEKGFSPENIEVKLLTKKE
ncbi:MAG: universal stress protein, partial [bacterium]|nr:universal stress protein [bacterium]